MTKLNLKLVMMLLGVIALTTVFNACSDDTSIVGKWKIVKKVVNGGTVPDYNFKKDYMEFFSNGTIRYVFNRHRYSLIKEIVVNWEWTLEGKTLTFDGRDNFPPPPLPVPAPITKSKYDHVKTTVFTIKELSSESMILLFEKILEDGQVKEEDRYEIIYLRRI